MLVKCKKINGLRREQAPKAVTGLTLGLRELLSIRACHALMTLSTAPFDVRRSNNCPLTLVRKSE